jgi:hypothetical protein
LLLEAAKLKLQTMNLAAGAGAGAAGAGAGALDFAGPAFVLPPALQLVLPPALQFVSPQGRPIFLLIRAHIEV